jgi:hypothetical protein
LYFEADTYHARGSRTTEMSLPSGYAPKNRSRFPGSIASLGVNPTTTFFGPVYRFWLSSQPLKYEVK